MSEMNPIETTKAQGIDDMEYWQSELRKCAADPYYFYSNYCLIDGKKPTMTREEYYDKTGLLKNRIPVKIRRNL